MSVDEGQAASSMGGDASLLSSPRADESALSGDALRAKKLFDRWQKTFLGAIDKQSEEYIIAMLREGEDLLESGMLDLNRSIKPASGSTFLHTVAWFQKARVLEWLLAHGADPNLGNLKGNTPLHLLCEQANTGVAPQLIQCMLDYGADVRQADHTGGDAVSKAKAVGFDVMQLSFERGKKFKAAQDAQRNGTHNTESLGGSGAGGSADASGDRDDGVPADLAPLSEAERTAGVDKAKMVYRKLSTLFLGLEASGVSKAVDDAIVRILTSNMHLVHHKLLDLNMPLADAGGKTFLHLAVCARRAEIVRVLLVGRADPNKGDEEGSTALHHSMAIIDEDNGPAIIAQLLDAGASKTKANYLRGLNALQSLPDTVSPEAKQWLQDYQPKLSSRMTATAFASKLQLTANGGANAAPTSPTHGHGRSGGSIGQVPPSPVHISGGEKQDRAGARALMARLASKVNAGNASSLAAGSGSGAEGVLHSPKNGSSALGLIQGNRAPTTTNARGSMGGNLFGGALASILSRNTAAAAGAGSGGGAAVGVLASAVARARGVANPASSVASAAKSAVGGKKSAGSKASERHLQLDELFRVLDLSELHVLTLAQVSALHQSFHAGCEGCPAWIVQQVLDCAIPAGCCTRANLLDILSQLTLQCAAQSKLAWDVALLDPDGMGALSTQDTAGATGAFASSAEMVWGSNQGDNTTKYEEFMARKQRTERTRPKEIKLSDMQQELLGKVAIN